MRRRKREMAVKEVLAEKGKTQADGAFQVAVKPVSRYRIQVQITGSPTAGTLAIGVKTPGAESYAAAVGSIDLVNGPLVKDIDGPAAGFEFTPSGYDGTSYDVIICSMGGC